MEFTDGVSTTSPFRSIIAAAWKHYFEIATLAKYSQMIGWHSLHTPIIFEGAVVQRGNAQARC